MKIEKTENETKYVDFLYKCRLCGEVYSEGSCPKENAFNKLVSTVLGIQLVNITRTQPVLTDVHIDCKKGTGVSDFIGYSEK